MPTSSELWDNKLRVWAIAIATCKITSLRVASQQEYELQACKLKICEVAIQPKQI